jgi:hypothetical protein
VAAAAVFEVIHFFFDDVRGLADGTLEKVEGLKRGRADLLKAELTKEVPGVIFQILEMARLGRKNVMRSTDSLVFRAHTDEELYDTKMEREIDHAR